MQKLALTLFISALVVGILARTGHAIPQFHKEFLNLYLAENGSDKKPSGSDKKPGGSDKKPDGSDKKAEGSDGKANLKEIATGSKTKCFVCHQGKKKKNHNPYGKELAKLLDKKKDKKDKKKIIEALKKVALVHTDPKDKKSPTYGNLIKAGMSPGGSLEEVKKEPAKGSDKKS